MSLQTLEIYDGVLVVNGEVKIPYPNKKRGGHHITQDGDHLYVDGYEWKNKEWKRTIRSVLNALFG